MDPHPILTELLRAARIGFGSRASRKGRLNVKRVIYTRFWTVRHEKPWLEVVPSRKQGTTRAVG